MAENGQIGHYSVLSFIYILIEFRNFKIFRTLRVLLIKYMRAYKIRIIVFCK